jgi:hypothetical protein
LLLALARLTVLWRRRRLMLLLLRMMVLPATLPTSC